MSVTRPSRVLLLALLVVSALVVTSLPATAATARSLSINASSTTPTVGATVTVSGTLSRSAKGSPVTVQRLSAGRWVTVKATKTTSSGGAWSAKVSVGSKPTTLKLRAVARAIKNRKTATSRTLAIDVRRRVAVTATAAPGLVELGDPVTVSGTVKPFVARTGVTIQTGSGRRVATTTVRTDGSYSATVKPTVAGTATYRAVVAGRTGYATATSATRSVTVQSSPVQPSISTQSLKRGQTDAAYSDRLRTDGDLPGTWSVDALPAGLRLDPSTGAITGTPTAPSSTTPTFTFTHTNGRTDQRTLALTISRVPSVTTTSLPVTSRGATYDVQLDSTEPGTWSLVGGALPRGLTLSAAGRISGTVTAPNVDAFPVEVKVTGSASGLVSPTRSLLVDVRAHIATTGLPAATVNQPYAARFRTNGTVSGSWEAVTPVPRGLSLAPDGLLSGTPTNASAGQLFIIRFRTTVPAVQEDQKDFTLPIENAMPSTPSRTQVSAGSDYGCRVLSTDGTLSCWGWDFKFNLGIGNQSTQNIEFSTPQRVGQETTWRQVSTGAFYTTCATRADDSLWCWGNNFEGQVGDPTASGLPSTPRRVAAERAWATTSVGEFHSCAVARAGSLWCWGSGVADALGGAPTSANGNANAPSLVDAGTWRSVSAGSGISCAIKADDSVWCWGLRAGPRPTKVDSASWRSVSTGYATACGVRTDDTLWCWGDNRAGQIGDGTTTNRATPVQVGTGRAWRSVSTNGANDAQTTCAVALDGSAWCWGSGDRGQLGDGLGASSLTPTPVDATTSWSSVSVGTSQACGVKNDGSQRCWGAGGRGQLGHGFKPERSLVPVTVG